MIDIRLIRRHPDLLNQMLERRRMPACADQILQLDATYRELLTQSQKIQAEMRVLAGRIGASKARQEPVQDLLDQAAALKTHDAECQERAHAAGQARDEVLQRLPNMLQDDVPTGADESANQQISLWGTPRLSTPSAIGDASASWVRDHVALGAGLRGLDFEQAGKVAGARFCYLQGPLARLERALGQWMLDVHTQEFGFTEMVVPLMVQPHALFGTGQLPKFAEDLFATTDGRYLIPTGEISLVNWARERTFSPAELPLCLTALTPCFRAEAGSAGRDTRGMIRQHQFHKVELVVVCTPDQSEFWHERITHQAEVLLQRLELPYRKMLLCSGDTGATAQKTYDLEVWMPGQNMYREIASCSRCGDFQARRMQAKMKADTTDQKDGMGFVHTLNGSGLPTGRTLIALLENHQDEEGNIIVPEVLHPYLPKDGTILKVKPS